MSTLETLIDQQIELGLTNPHDAYDAIVKAAGEDILELAKPYLADFINDMTRQKMNARRRSSIAKIKPGALNQDVLLKRLWVPGGGSILYKRIADMTADDFDARADYLERMMRGIATHIAWCRTVANEIRTHNVKTAGKLNTLPCLPNDPDA